jgi:hypothetical protein
MAGPSHIGRHEHGDLAAIRHRRFAARYLLRRADARGECIGRVDWKANRGTQPTFVDVSMGPPFLTARNGLCEQCHGQVIVRLHKLISGTPNTKCSTPPAGRKPLFSGHITIRRYDLCGHAVCCQFDSLREKKDQVTGRLICFHNLAGPMRIWGDLVFGNK